MAQEPYRALISEEVILTRNPDQGANLSEDFLITRMHVNRGRQRTHMPRERLRQEEVLGRRLDFLAGLEVVITAGSSGLSP